MDRKGSFSVYAAVFLSVLVMVAGLFISSAKAEAFESVARSCGKTWAQSILAEYDLNLEERYHLFGYYGSTALVKEKLCFYAASTFGEEDSGRIAISSCNLSHHALRNTEVFKKQVTAWGKLAAAGGSHEPNPVVLSVAGHQRPSREILFSDLPSDGSVAGISLRRLAQTLEENGMGRLVEEGTNAWFEMEYIFSHYKDRAEARNLGETYLQQEIEYILCGKESDAANGRSVKAKIVGLREFINLSCLQRDPVKSGAAMAAAELLTPGPAAPATAQSIMALWAYAESVNDYQLLIEGYKVPAIKTADTWAVSLESVLEEDGVEGCIYTGAEEGQTYQDYLRLLLVGMEESTRLLRMMDLIQINMRYNYYERFSIEDYYGGVTYTIEAEGKTCHVEDTYA